MITIPANIEIFIAIESVDFRKGINGLSRVCRELMKKDPMKGAMFVFRNKRKTTLKILYYDGEAFWLLMRRLSSGRIKWWPKSNKDFTDLESKMLQTLIMNGNPEAAEFGADWKKLI